jgi:exodeoxyribonuclease VII large subunit
MEPRNPKGGILSVTALTALIKNSLETSFSSLSVEGEISGAKIAASGHMYFSLKDSGALIQAVMFKSRCDDLGFIPQDGQKVLAQGSLSVYPPRGQYQLIVQSMRKSGIGDILATLEERKRMLASEGLFDEARKRPLPRLPTRVGVVTSRSGAAFKDILNVLGRRNSGVGVLLFPTLVQGDKAAEMIAARIRQANFLGDIDVLIVGRGGGSMEDLLPFSEECVVRAIAASKIPVISAVGHEIDWSLADFAADLRAPTPSAAAELVAESRSTIEHEILLHRQTLEASISARLDYARASLSVFSREDGEAHFMRRLMPLSRRFDEAGETLREQISSRVESLRHRMVLAGTGLELASPRTILERGYSIVRRANSDSIEGGEFGEGSIIRKASSLVPGSKIHVYFAAGMAAAEVEKVKE